MKLNIEHITEKNRFWKEVNILAKEAFPPEEYLAPVKLVEMAKDDNFEPKEFKEMMKTIQVEGFQPRYFNK